MGCAEEIHHSLLLRPKRSDRTGTLLTFAFCPRVTVREELHAFLLTSINPRSVLAIQAFVAPAQNLAKDQDNTYAKVLW